MSGTVKGRFVRPSLDRVIYFACGAFTCSLLVMAMMNPPFAIGYLLSAVAIAGLGLFAR